MSSRVKRSRTRGEHAVHVGGAADVRLDGECFPAQGPDLFYSGIGARAIGVVIDRDVAAAAGQLERDPFPDSFARAGDQCVSRFERCSHQSDSILER